MQALQRAKVVGLRTSFLLMCFELRWYSSFLSVIVRLSRISPASDCRAARGIRVMSALRLYESLRHVSRDMRRH